MASAAAKLLQVRGRREWCDWLKAHHKTEREIWLVYFKKRSGRGRITDERFEVPADILEAIKADKEA